jgi:Cu/Zn superoxide dismutase
MSSDPTRPNPEWWQSQEPQGHRGSQGSRGGPGPQGTQRFPVGPGYDQGYPGGQGQGYPAGRAGRRGRSYQAAPPARYRRRRHRWPFVTLIVIVLILLGADRAANAYTENQFASQVQSSLELSGKPQVSIEGFPFLTQLAARDFRTVDISASNETAGTAGQLEISSLTATLHGMHIHGLSSATVDQFSASALIDFSALAKAGGIPQGITLSADGPNQVKAEVSIGPLSDTAVAQVTQSGSSQVNIKIVKAGGIPLSLLGSATNFTITIPKLPAGVSIQSVSVTQQGLRIAASGRNTTLSQ